MLLSTDRSSIDITPEGPGLSVLFCTPLIRRDTGVVVVGERACAAPLIDAGDGGAVVGRTHQRQPTTLR